MRGKKKVGGERRREERRGEEVANTSLTLFLLGVNVYRCTGMTICCNVLAAHIVSLTSKTISRYRCVISSAKVTAGSLGFSAIFDHYLIIFVYHKNTASRTGRQPDKLMGK